MAQHMNMAKGIPALTVASKDHRGYWRGFTVIGCPPLACRHHRDILELRPKVLSIPGSLLSQILMTGSVSYDRPKQPNKITG
jgi:hypothetical protein